MGRIALLERIEYEYEYRDAEYEYEKKYDLPCSCKSWPRRHEADGGQEELDGCLNCGDADR
jgi:hypothetical protein